LNEGPMGCVCGCYTDMYLACLYKRFGLLCLIGAFLLVLVWIIFAFIICFGFVIFVF